MEAPVGGFPATLEAEARPSMIPFGAPPPARRSRADLGETFPRELDACNGYLGRLPIREGAALFQRGLSPFSGDDAALASPDSITFLTLASSLCISITSLANLSDSLLHQEK